MKKTVTTGQDEPLSFDDFDDVHYPRDEASDISGVIDTAISKRRFVFGTLASSVMASVSPAKLFADSKTTNTLSFAPVAATTADTITLPMGFSWHVVVSWGDPLWSGGQAFDPLTRGTGQNQQKAFGDNNDGMSLFFKGERSILVANNEYTNSRILFGNRKGNKAETKDDFLKSIAAHGVSIAEIKQTESGWKVVVDSPFNHRITAQTPMQITGPAAGHDLLKTHDDPTGKLSFGTWNNCANGQTPWGTYLTCEENFNGYFSTDDDFVEITPQMKRYGIGRRGWGYDWAKYDDRFDIAKTPNEYNRNGYVVEIDPFDKSTQPRKRTALGRFKHENAEVVIASNDHVVVYMGDDERGEYIYRFVSEKKFIAGGENSDLLQAGKLFVAKFNDDLTGKWLELSPETTGMSSQAEVCIHTRLAASAVGGTTMDRPEWVAVHPDKPEVYCSLTNNKNRGRKPNKGGDETPVGGPNPRKKNKYGQIVRWRPKHGDHTALEFDWDLFVIAGNPAVHDDARGGSANINQDNMFNSPDGLSFDTHGQLWIRTDGKTSNAGDYAGMGNNQLLVADPKTKEIRRFLVGPGQAELTGLAWSKDKKTMFLGVQHPGARGQGHFPGNADGVPRSSIIAITRDDEGLMG